MTNIASKYVNPNAVGDWRGPEARLMLAVIAQAQEDVMRRRYRHERTALAFFKSEWYVTLATCLGMEPGVYPVGVDERIRDEEKGVRKLRE